MNILRRIFIYTLPDKQREIVRYWLNSIPAFFYRNDLCKLAKLFGTDKYEHGYCPIYEHYFHSIKNKELRILEIGVGGGSNIKFGGNSLKMWAKFFTKSEILGIDIYDKSFVNYRRIRTFQGNQSDAKFLTQFSSLDIIIDDGSHINSDVIASFETLFPRLNSGGYYCVEDMQVSNIREYHHDDYPSTLDYFLSLKNQYKIDFYEKLVVVRK